MRFFFTLPLLTGIVIGAVLTLYMFESAALYTSDSATGVSQTDLETGIDETTEKPSCETTIYDVCKKSPSLSRFLDQINSTNLEKLLQDERTKLTVFIPTNKAFDLADNDLNQLQDMDTLAIMYYHVIPGLVDVKQLVSPTLLKTAFKSTPLFVRRDKKRRILVNNAPVEKTSIVACNGIVNTISKVMLTSRRDRE